MTTIGFTGTRQGMTTNQKITLNSLIEELHDVLDDDHHVLTGHQGQCVGADETFHAICHKLNIACHAWPASDVATKWISRNHYPGDTVHPAMPALMRNKVIIAESDRIIATPNTEYYIKGSGTWYTIKHARETPSKILYLITPNGALLREVTS